MSNNKYEYNLRPHRIDYGVEVEIEGLLVDPQAQRELDERRAQGIGNNLIPSALGTLTISERSDGRRFIVDGMHRRRGGQLAGMKRMYAEIHYGLTAEEEAILFLIKNRESKAPNPLAEFKVGVTAGVPIYRDINETVRSLNLSVGTNSANQISAVRALENVIKRGGTTLLKQVLTVLDETWGRSPDTWNGSLINGLGEFIASHPQVVETPASRAKLIKTLQKGGTPNSWVGYGVSIQKNGSSGGISRGICKSLRYRWNGSMKPTNKNYLPGN